MYCVKCGVKLREGTNKCPLCGTKVYNPDKIPLENNNYPDNYPEIHKNSNRPDAIVMTVICALAAAIILLICAEVYGEIFWGGYATLGIAVFYMSVVLPLWFDKPNPVIFTPVVFVSVIGYLLYINCKTGGSWFLPFAFPVVGIFGIFMTSAVALSKYVPKGRIFTTAGSFIFLGGFTMLIEFFQSITFGSEMFRWSIYSASVFAAAGIFLLLIGLIKPLREYLNKVFFM